MSDLISAAQPHLSLEMKHRLGTLDIDAAFKLTKPWTVLFGPSGSGKSSVLRAIAGLLRPASARIVLRRNGREDLAADTACNIWLPAPSRPVRWIAQRPALFPHMTVRENLNAVTAVPGQDRSRLVETVIEQFHLGSIGGRRPGLLSGGEQQRASVARAICSASGSREISLLLLDEPFSGLDAPLRDQLLEDLRGWLARARTPVLSVTHDVGEAFLLDAEVVRLDHGRVTQQGPVAQVLAEDRRRLIEHLGNG